MKFWKKQLDAEYARGYQRGLDDGLEESARRRAAALEQVWAIIDDAGPGQNATCEHRAADRQAARGQASALHSDPVPVSPSNVVAIHLRRADGKWHL